MTIGWFVTTVVASCWLAGVGFALALARMADRSDRRLGYKDDEEGDV